MGCAPHAFEGPITLIEGAPGTGKTEALVRRAVALMDEGAPAASIALFAATPASAEVLRQRLADAVGDGEDLPLVGTVRSFALAVLASPEAQRRFGRRPVVLLDFEEAFLLEDLKLTQVAPRRLAEMLKFFYRSWADLEPMEGAWFYNEEEERVYDRLVKGLQGRRAYAVAEVARRAWEALSDDDALVARLGFDHVLVDDLPLLSRASQTVALLAARESFTAAGDPLVGGHALEDYPFTAGLDDLAQHYPQSQRVRLRESHKSEAVGRALELVAADIEQAQEKRPQAQAVEAPAPQDGDGVLALLECPRAEDECEAVAEQVAQLVAQGRAPEDMAVIAVTPRWTGGVLAALKRRGIPCATVVRPKVAGDFRFPERCRAARAVTLLKLAADPTDPVALRSWCGFGDHLANSSLMATLVEAGDCPTLQAEAPALPPQPGARLQQEAARVAEALERGRAAVAALDGLTGRALVERAWQAVGGTAEEGLPAALVLAVQDGGDKADATALVAALEQRCLFPALEGQGVLVGGLDDFLGLSLPVVVVAGLVNGLVPSRSYFDPARVERDRRPELLARDQRRILGALAVAERELYLSTFAAASLTTAENLQLKIDRVRLRDGERLCDVSPSETVRALTGVYYHD